MTECDINGHAWMPDDLWPFEGMVCSSCGITEAELDAQRHGTRSGGEPS